MKFVTGYGWKQISYNICNVVFMCSLCYVSLSHILISDLLVANLSMHSLPGKILIYLALRFLLNERNEMKEINEWKIKGMKEGIKEWNK